ncbi:hypothetical protein G6F59_018504 [Rhizopus arrhizus]|nr:hypothetical protein G6F59_018504 [Rhizopus arrhizus]
MVWRWTPTAGWALDDCGARPAHPVAGYLVDGARWLSVLHRQPAASASRIQWRRGSAADAVHGVSHSGGCEACANAVK